MDMFEEKRSILEPAGALALKLIMLKEFKLRITFYQQVVPPNEETILKEFTFSELQRATRNFGEDIVIGEGGFGRVYKGWLDNATYEPTKIGDMMVAIKKSKADSAQSLKEWQAIRSSVIFSRNHNCSHEAKC